MLATRQAGRCRGLERGGTEPGALKMSPDQWKQVKELFAAARERSAADRHTFLAQRCPTDEALRSEVRSLLAEYDALEEFMAGPAAAGLPSGTAGTGDTSALGSAALPTYIGRYRVLGILGRGGMSTVYLAEQDHPRRTVALKVLQGGIPSRLAVRRFQQEAQILARLQHPGIAPIYEAGTADGDRGPQPYFAMERITGRPLSEHAVRYALDLTERLALFVKVCEAVQHAHQKGIIHRDLKPSNILVAEPGPRAPPDPDPAHDGAEGAHVLDTGAVAGDGGPARPGWVGQPKVLDFGIARMIDADVQALTLGTAAGQLIGTIPYMSPEQMAGEVHELDTRTDVYSLGVVLYELLCERSPYDLAGTNIPEALRILAERDPIPPRKACPAVPGDLEGILLKALERDKTRRYASVAELAADLQRYLRHEPVVAHPPTTLYRARKFVRRHALAMAAVIGVFLALALGLAGTGYGLLHATAERNRAREAQRRAEAGHREAEERRAAAESVTRLLEEMLGAADPHRVKGADYAVRQLLDDFAGSLGDQLADQPEVEAAVRATIGNAYRRLGLLERAEEHLRVALALRRRVLGPQDPRVPQSVHDYAWAIHDLADYPRAAGLFREALAQRRALLGAEHPDVAASLIGLADVLRHQGVFAEAEDLARESLGLRQRLLGDEHPDTAESLIHLARVLRDRGDYDTPEPLIREALRIWRRARGNEHPEIADALNDLGWIYFLRRDFAAAEGPLREALTMGRKLLGPRHSDTATSLYELGLVLHARARYDEAEARLREALEIYRGHHDETHPAVINTLGGLAKILRARREYEAAENIVRQVLAVRRQSLGELHPDVAVSLGELAALMRDRGDRAAAAQYLREQLDLYRRLFPGDNALVATSLGHLGNLLKDLRELDAAQACHEEALAMRRRLFGDVHPDVARSLWSLAGVCEARADDVGCEQLARQAAELFAATCGDRHPDTASCRSLLGACLMRLGRYEAAEENLRGAHEVLETALGTEHTATLNARQRLIQLYDAWGKPGLAEPWRASPQPANSTPAASSQSSAHDD